MRQTLSPLDSKSYKGEHGGIIHDKFCVIDKLHVICGSYNWTVNAEKKNDEVAVFHCDNSKLASSFTKKFNQIWRRDKKPI